MSSFHHFLLCFHPKIAETQPRKPVSTPTASPVATIASTSPSTSHPTYSGSKTHKFKGNKSSPFANSGRRSTRINFEFTQPAEQLFSTDRLPSQVTELLVYLAREAIGVPDIFRRSGSSQDIKRILRQLRDGSRVVWTDYSFYTLANVTKRFLLSVEGGILGADAENLLINALHLPSKEETMEAMHKVIMSLQICVQSLLVLLFGTWFRMMYHTDVNSMCLEGVAKSVAGSVFLNSCSKIDRVDLASNAMQFLIHNFPSSSLFGPQLLHYFAQMTKTSITGVERFQYTLQYPTNVPRENCIREFVKMLKIESDQHGFDLLRDVTSKDKFDEAGGDDMNDGEGSNLFDQKGQTLLAASRLNSVNKRNSLVVDKRRSMLIETELKVMSMLETDVSYVAFNSTPQVNSDVPVKYLERLHNRSSWFNKAVELQQLNPTLSNSQQLTLPTGTPHKRSSSAVETRPRPSTDLLPSPRLLCTSSTPEKASIDHLCRASGLQPTQQSPDIKEETVYFVVKRVYGPL